MRALLVTSCLLAGCFDPKFDPDDGEFLCDEKCPSGYRCSDQGICVSQDEPTLVLSVDDDQVRSIANFPLYNSPVQLSFEIEAFDVPADGHVHLTPIDPCEGGTYHTVMALSSEEDLGGFVEVLAELAFPNHELLETPTSSDSIEMVADDAQPHIVIASPPRGEVLSAGTDATDLSIELLHAPLGPNDFIWEGTSNGVSFDTGNNTQTMGVPLDPGMNTIRVQLIQPKLVGEDQIVDCDEIVVTVEE